MKNEKLRQHIITTLRLENTPADQQEAILAKVEALAQARLINVLPEILTNEQIREFNTLQESGKSDDELIVWLNAQIVNIDELATDITSDVVDELAGSDK